MATRYPLKKFLKLYNKDKKKNYRIHSDITKAEFVLRNYHADSYISYCEDGFIEENSVNYFFAYKIKPNTLSRSEFIQFLTDYETKHNDVKIEIWPPDKIRYAYLDTNYYSTGSGTLGGSCMRHKHMQKALNFYIQNNTHIVVAVDENKKIHARALLWYDVKSVDIDKKTFTYLDRCYYRVEKFKNDFIALAKENKWYCFHNDSNKYPSFYIDNIITKGICHLPYADTFRSLFYKDNILTYSSCRPKQLKYSHNCSSLTSTHENGYHKELDPHYTIEVFTGNAISKKDAVLIKRYDGYVLKKNIVDIGGTYYSKFDENNIVESPIDKYILKSNSVKEVITEDIIDKTKSIKVKHYKGYVHKKNLIEIMGENYHKKDKDIIKYDNKYYHVSQCVSNWIYVPDGAQYSWQPAEGETIPKERAIICYNIIEKEFKPCSKCSKLEEKDYHKLCDKCVIEFHKVSEETTYEKKYMPDTFDNYIELINGMNIIANTKNRKLIKKFNKKYHIRKEFSLPDKKQLVLPFMEAH